MNKKSAILITVVVIILAGIFVYQGMNKSEENPGIDIGTEKPSENGELTTEDAVTLVGEIFDSKDYEIGSYSKKIEVQGDMYIVVDLVNKENQELNKLVVNVVSGEIFTYDGTDLGLISDITNIEEVDSVDWNGIYQGDGAKVEFLMADTNFFEFTLTTTGVGVAKEFVGVAEIKGQIGVYDDGNYKLEFKRQGDSLTITEAGSPPFATFAGIYTK